MPSRWRISVIDWPTEEVLTTEVLHVSTPVTRLVSYSVPAVMGLDPWLWTRGIQHGLEEAR
mgnify:CR=1 FL=1